MNNYDVLKEVKWTIFKERAKMISIIISLVLCLGISIHLWVYAISGASIIVELIFMLIDVAFLIWLISIFKEPLANLKEAKIGVEYIEDTYMNSDKFDKIIKDFKRYYYI